MNASGKSRILDGLWFLHEGVQARDFRSPVFSRGGEWQTGPVADSEI
jgi:hypothetical protein